MSYSYLQDVFFWGSKGIHPVFFIFFHSTIISAVKKSNTLIIVAIHVIVILDSVEIMI